MKSSLRLLSLCAALTAGAGSAHATLVMWQGQVTGAGTTPATTLFTTVNGAAPQLFDVGNLTGDRSFEFIYNAGVGGASQALIGSQAAVAGAQGLKVNQWNNTGMYGVTDFGVVDVVSPIPFLQNQNVHIVFTSNGVDTLMYLNGSLSHTFGGTDLTITGVNGIGAAVNAAGTGFFDNLAGDVLGFASYDSALSPAEILTHSQAFAAVPEPSASGLAILAGLAAARRRRR
ncbi:MAG TPA: LamG-like jellyroll fold domain-containing protein [Verrucomicrobiales bacterium]|jgi:hypothetical protein|nr:LamG-like jellyroll fold domain-containing protein [Verrucomicrobiales bacterium]